MRLSAERLANLLVTALNLNSEALSDTGEAQEEHRELKDGGLSIGGGSDVKLSAHDRTLISLSGHPESKSGLVAALLLLSL